MRAGDREFARESLGELILEPLCVFGKSQSIKCCVILQYVAACCSVLQCVAVCGSVFDLEPACMCHESVCYVLNCVACVAASCRVLHCVVVVCCSL